MSLFDPSKIKDQLARFFSRFSKEKDGVMTVEMVITLPLLFWMITTSFELFEVHQYKSVRIKATYTVADMLSREMQTVNDTYMDTAKSIFDAQANDGGDNQLRMSVVVYSAGTESYWVRWSEVRGDGPMSELTTAEVAQAHAELPVLQGGEELIIVESVSNYQPTFIYPGLNNSYTARAKVFTGIRFASQLCWEDSYCG
ncbi:TadE/TadG family type IV pilus assembly protein [Roseovarius sp. 2305UL8-3]|uniref:TadE/TadG family type IV pilus assembly protein n=1 Tax=Roseovarius conchicola TaxID=3121636 RepID=UPI003528ED21